LSIGGFADCGWSGVPSDRVGEKSRSRSTGAAFGWSVCPRTGHTLAGGALATNSEVCGPQSLQTVNDEDF